MERTILHVDMDAFYAAVEARDDPTLAGAPLIIGALPHERGVVATCSYEARKFGVHSGMNIKDAYRLCPNGIYRHPDMGKYRRVSLRLNEIWRSYADVVERVALDEGYLDVTRTAERHGGARAIARAIKERTRAEIGLTCSVGLGCSMTSAKLASEERKPDGYHEILTPEAFVALAIDRDIRVLHGVGEKTARRLEQAGIFTVRDVRARHDEVIAMLGKPGRQIVDLSFGRDDRPVVSSDEAEAKSIGREITFQKDTADLAFLKDVLIVLSLTLERRLRRLGSYCRTVVLKVTYWNMKGATRSRSGERTDRAYEIYLAAAGALDGLARGPVRLIGIALQELSRDQARQLTFADIGGARDRCLASRWEESVSALQQRYAIDLFPPGAETEGSDRFYDAISRMRERIGGQRP